MNEEWLRLLNETFYNQKDGFMGVNELVRRLKRHVPSRIVREWYRQQTINQIIVPKRIRIEYHKTIGDGHGYQGDILFLPYPRLNKGFIGLLTFINTSTRKASVAEIKSRTTEELLDIIQVWIDHVESTDGKVNSIATDNELYNNRAISRLFDDNGVEHFVETAGEHTKLGIINRFHRTLRDLLNKMMTHDNSKKWIDYIGDVIHNYNHRIHRTLGKSPIEMSLDDVGRLNISRG